MSSQELPPAILVDDDRGMGELMQDLRGQAVIAVDTEADSFFSYREKVCLVQITVEDRDYIVDPLAKIDLSPLGEILADQDRIKVFHDGEYDILILKRDFGFEFKNLFDTRVAAATLGAEAPGLASVLSEHFGVELDKSMQRSNWGERPLSSRQIDYARLDTRYLIPLMDELKTQLEDHGRMMILEGECKRLEALIPQDTGFRPDEWVRVKGSRTLNPVERSVLKEIYAVRDEIAKESNSPLFRVINNQTLLAIATAKPRSVSALTAIHGFSPRQSRKFGNRILDAVKRGLEEPPINRFPRLPPKDGTGGFDDEQIELHERLKTWRKNRAAEEGFDASLLLNRHALIRLVQTRPKSVDEIEPIEGIWAWQVDRYADEILDVVRVFEQELADGLDLTKRRRRSR